MTDTAHKVLAASDREDQQSEALLTVKEYSQLFGLHVQTVYTAIRYGHRLHGRVIRASARSIRIAVPRESIRTLKSA